MKYLETCVGYELCVEKERNERVTSVITAKIKSSNQERRACYSRLCCYSRDDSWALQHWAKITSVFYLAEAN